MQKTKLSEKITIVVPCKNEENYIHHLLDSLISQNIGDTRVIIADCSTDNTREVIKTYNTQLNVEIIDGGPVSFARRGDGSIDTNKSDSCELIDENGDLIPYFIDPRFAQLFTNKEIESFDISMPHVIHLGYVDLNKRIENNKFWQPIWSNRNGEEVKTAVSLEQLEKENKYFKHKQKSPWWV